MISEEDPDKQVLNAAKRLKQMIAREVQAQKHMTKAIGSLEMIMKVLLNWLSAALLPLYAAIPKAPDPISLVAIDPAPEEMLMIAARSKETESPDFCAEAFRRRGR